MRKSAVLTVLLLTVAIVAATAAPTLAAGVTKEQLDKVIKQLIANGELWTQDNSIPTDDLADVKSLKFDKASAPVAIKAFRGIKRTISGLYASARLLEQIQLSDAETVSAFVQDARMLQSRVRNTYRRFPVVSKAMEESLVMPKYHAKLNTNAIMARMATLSDRRVAKRARDLPIAKQNEVAWDIELAAFNIQAVGGSRTEDSRAISMMMKAEHTGDATFLAIANAYIAAAPKMEADRAARLYQSLRSHALRLKMANKKNYMCKGECELSGKSTSTFTSTSDYPGIKLIFIMNRLAAVAKDKNCKTIKPPTSNEIKEFNKKRR